MLTISEEELNMVTGGDMLETADDSHALYKRGLMPDEFNVLDLLLGWGEYSKCVDDGWANAGIVSVTSPFSSNKYLLRGKEISREEALHDIGY